MRPSNLRTRLVIAYTAAAAIVISLLSFLAVQAVERNLRSTLDSALAARATPFLQALADPGTPLLPGAASPNARRVTESLAVIIDPQGVVRHSEPAQAATTVLPVLPSGSPRPDTTTVMNARVAGEQLRLRVDRVARADGTWTVATGTGEETADAAAEKVQDALEICAPILLVLIVVGTWLLAGAALRPVEHMRAQAAALGAGDPDTRLTVLETADELHALGLTFNDLLDRLHDSLQRQRQFAIDAGHELRTPLARLCAELERAESSARSSEQLRGTIVAARAETTRLKDLAEDLLMLASLHRRPDEPVDLAEVVATAVAGLRAQAREAGVELVVRIDRAHVVAGDQISLRRALEHLLSNALRHSTRGGRVEVRTATAGSDKVSVSVHDGGPGLPPEFQGQGFGRSPGAETTRAPGTGAGLGLSIVASVVTAHGGRTTAGNNRSGPGACVSFTLPRIPQPP